MEKIKEVRAREILDSRGNPTVEVDISTRNFWSRAMVPSGASRGKHEAWELRDGGKRFLGKGVRKAVNNVNKVISKKIKGIDCTKQKEIDELMIELDGTVNKRKLGANAILGVSMGVCRLGALAEGKWLYEHIAELFNNKKVMMPRAFFNVINGGKHAGSGLAIQEFMMAPKMRNFKENLRIGAEIYHVLKGIIKKKYGASALNVGDEGGFVPGIKKAEEALDLLKLAIKKADYLGKVDLAIDCAASSFFKENFYFLDDKKFNRGRLLDYYLNLIKKYKIISIEDPFEEEDFNGFGELLKKSRIQVVGDDLLCTNRGRIKEAIKKKSCNCLLLKVNQIGTVSEALEAARLAMDNRWGIMVSHRSGETEDTFIADLVVGLGCGQIKAGAPCRSERVAKYNRLLRIEERLRK